MNKMTSQELRQKFLDYFKKLDHTIVPSSSLIPGNDPTLLFTNAGMVQFKETFLGLETRPYVRAASVQRCVRAGGKHNDLENVGHTRRHHTFFEMLGNFSFGDYFKEEAIRFAWEFLTSYLGIPAERLWVTVYKDDKESEKIWLEKLKVDPQRFSRCGEKDNFWSMGDVGPCGPCTEIFFDHGQSVAGGPPGSPDSEGDRYVEIWNIVFMQFDRDPTGKLTSLPKPCVDTGMGLERIAAVMQGVHDNYDIDTFQYLLQALAEITGCTDFQSPSMRVIVDHIRSCSFLIADGVTPSNEGRGYVLRRIIRRAVRHGYKLGQQQTFFYRLVPALVKIMGDAYPELIKSQVLIEQVLRQEEDQFSNTLENGLKVFDDTLSKLEGTQIPGQAVFQLYDTYGFPIDLTADLARERGFGIDYQGFEQAMERQRQQSQQSQQFKMQFTQQLHIPEETEFTGYEKTADEGQVTTLLLDHKPVSQLESGQRGTVVLDRTPFYAESGGQVGDTGYLRFEGGHFRVEDTQKHGQAYLHYGKMIEGKLSLKDKVRAEVDGARHDIMLNHSATHLLHEALRRVLGDHVVQKGSLVAADRLRFDFSHPKPLTHEQTEAIEQWINQAIQADVESHVEEGTLDEAKQKGAVALFGEKYGHKVRMVSMGQFSHEVCGGTHVRRTGQIGIFKITAQTSLAAGVRRLEAVTGLRALEWIRQGENQLQEIAGLLKVEKYKILEKMQQILNEQRILAKEVAQLKQQLASHATQSFIKESVEVNGISVLALKVDESDRDTLRKMIDQLKQQFDKGVILLTSIKDGNVQLICGLTKNLLAVMDATKLVREVYTQLEGGKGWGRPDLAEGIGKNPERLSSVLTSFPELVKNYLK